MSKIERPNKVLHLTSAAWHHQAALAGERQCSADSGWVMPERRDFKILVEALRTATAAVEGTYYQLPVAGKETAAYRERVYCYELYHRLRVALPSDFPYVLSGEVDKSGHPLLRTPLLNRRKPDFLIHSPGNMDRNLVAIEVKPVNASKLGLAKDLSTLRACLTDADYAYGILLVYGCADSPWRSRLKAAASSEVSIEHIHLYWHHGVGQAASAVDWREII